MNDFNVKFSQIIRIGPKMQGKTSFSWGSKFHFFRSDPTLFVYGSKRLSTISLYHFVMEMNEKEEETKLLGLFPDDIANIVNLLFWNNISRMLC